MTNEKDQKSLYKTVDYRVDGRIAIITLNRPNKRNALNTLLLEELRNALQDAEEDGHIRVAIITGTGKGFCSGADINGEGTGGLHITDYLNDCYKPLIMQIDQMGKTVISAVNGIAAGAGCSIAMACDITIMADDAFFLQAFSNIGLIPDAGATWFLTHTIGYKRAYQLVIEGEKLSAQQCVQLGLANMTVAPNQLMEQSLAMARKYAERAPVALRLSKDALKKSMQLDLADAISYEADLQGIAASTLDAQEGVNAFLEKRKPSYKGI